MAVNLTDDEAVTVQDSVHDFRRKRISQARLGYAASLRMLRETTTHYRYNQLGPDTGYDCINTYSSSAEMAAFLNALNATDELPKTIIYSLNPD